MGARARARARSAPWAVPTAWRGGIIVARAAGMAPEQATLPSSRYIATTTTTCLSLATTATRGDKSVRAETGSIVNKSVFLRRGLSSNSTTTWRHFSWSMRARRAPRCLRSQIYVAYILHFPRWVHFSDNAFCFDR